jgi:recombinational DNA repair protein (RecF pathway)
MLKATRALALDARPLGENDLVVAFLEESGALRRASVRGGQSARHPWLGCFILWSEVEIAYEARAESGLVRLELCTLVRSRFDSFADAEAGAYLHALAGLARTLTQEGLERPPLYRLMHEALDAPEGRRAATLLYASAWALRFEGSFPDPKRCAECGGAFGAGGAWWFRKNRTLACERCNRGRTAPALDAEALRALGRILRERPGVFARSPLPPRAMRRVGRFVEKVFYDCLGLRLNPLADFEKTAARATRFRRRSAAA